MQIFALGAKRPLGVHITMPANTTEWCHMCCLLKLHNHLFIQSMSKESPAAQSLTGGFKGVIAWEDDLACTSSIMCLCVLNGEVQREANMSRRTAG
jgi:hypothetical protein